MVCSTEVYQWFKELSPFNRIDFLCSIMQLCLPNELRFIGTLLDDMNNKDYANLREAEDRSNSPNEFRQYPIMPFTEEGVRKLCLSLSLLKSTNQTVGQIIYEILKIHFSYANECVKLKDKFSNEVLLLYALASYHPAFTFENRFKIGKQFKILQSIYEDSSEKFSNNNNNSCCYTDINTNSFFKINIKSVTLELLDAYIILEISSNNPQNSKMDKQIQKVTTFSKIIELCKESKYFNSDLFSTLHLQITDINKNGNFNVNNIRGICQKIIEILNSSSDEKNQFIKKIFSQLPVNQKKTKSHSSQIEMTDSNSRGDLFVNNDEIPSKSNFKCFDHYDSTQTSCYEGLINETPIKDNLNKNVKYNNSEKSVIILKEDIFPDLKKDLRNQIATESIYNSIKMQKKFENSPREMSDSIISSDELHFQDVNPFQVPNNNNNNNNINNSCVQIHQGNISSNKQSHSEQLILTTFHPHVFPMFYLINPYPRNIIPCNALHFVTSQSPTVTGSNKLSSSSSSTPPRLQSNYHKSTS